MSEKVLKFTCSEVSEVASGPPKLATNTCKLLNIQKKSKFLGEGYN